VDENGSTLRLLESPVRRDIIDILANLSPVHEGDGVSPRSRGLTASQLGERLDLHVTTVRFHVDQLVDGGLLLAHDERHGVGRPRRRYVANPGALSDVVGSDAYRVLAQMLASALASAEPFTAEQAGRNWVIEHAATLLPSGLSEAPALTPGQWLAKIGVAIDLLERWGYAPSVSTTRDGRTAELTLAHCPLRELALTNPAVACGVHRGVMEGTLQALGEDAEINLVPFVEPHLCIARVTTHAEFGRPTLPLTATTSPDLSDPQPGTVPSRRSA